MSQQTQLPNSFEAEQGVLASLIYAPYLLCEAADTLTGDDFYYHSYRHPEIFAAMRHLYYQEIEIDTATLLEQLKQQGVTEIHEAHALSYLHDLWQIGLEHGPSLQADMAIVRNLATKRKEYAALEKAGQIISAEPDAQKALILIQAAFSSINQQMQETTVSPLMHHVDDFLADLDTHGRHSGAITGVSTGLSDLDYALGGMQYGELIVLGGQASEGKTSLALNILYHLIRREQLYVAMFSLEMPGRDLIRRLVSMDTGINSMLLRSRNLHDHEWDAIVASADHLYNDHVFLDDSGDLSVASMRSKLDRLKAKHGLDLVIVDYLQLMQNDEEASSSRESEAQQLTRISHGLKKLAKHFDVPVLVLVSLNRAAEQRADKTPHLSDIRGSGSIGFDADVVMFVTRIRERPGYSLVNIEKNRNGPIGDLILRFDPTLTRFYNAEGSHGEEEERYS